MGTPEKASVRLLVGTHKGGFIFASDLDRKKWQMQGPFFRGSDVNHMVLDIRNDPTIYACVNSSWFGPNVQISKDFGAHWTQSESAIGFEEGSDKSVKKVWHVSAGREHEPDVLFAGVDPGALFRSDDGGQSWSEIKALTGHSTSRALTERGSQRPSNTRQEHELRKHAEHSTLPKPH